MDYMTYGLCVIHLLAKDKAIDRAMKVIEHGPCAVLGLDMLIFAVIEDCWQRQVTPEVAMEMIRPYPLQIADEIEKLMLMNMPIQGTH